MKYLVEKQQGVQSSSQHQRTNKTVGWGYQTKKNTQRIGEWKFKKWGRKTCGKGIFGKRHSSIQWSRAHAPVVQPCNTLRPFSQSMNRIRSVILNFVFHQMDALLCLSKKGGNGWAFVCRDAEKKAAHGLPRESTDLQWHLNQFTDIVCFVLFVVQIPHEQKHRVSEAY